MLQGYGGGIKMNSIAKYLSLEWRRCAPSAQRLPDKGTKIPLYKSRATFADDVKHCLELSALI